MTDSEILKLNLEDPTNRRLAEFGGKVFALFSRSGVQSDPNTLGSLDDLLGAIYSLIMARHCQFVDRPSQPIDITAPKTRASQIQLGDVRVTGKWIAGWHFNSALFRIAALYHRLLKVSAGEPASRKNAGDLLPKVERLYHQKTRGEWASDRVQGIYKEVNELKHSPRGVYSGRATTFEQALEGIGELITLMEA